MAEAYLKREAFKAELQAAAVGRLLAGNASAGGSRSAPAQPKRVQKDPMQYAMLID